MRNRHATARTTALQATTLVAPRVLPSVVARRLRRRRKQAFRLSLSTPAFRSGGPAFFSYEITMAISAADVKKLRDQTGAGMMDCKAALEESNGNFEEANTILRKKGLASAA